MRALRVCLAMYRAVRYLAISPYVSAPVRATISVVAGCGVATTWVKVYTLELFVEAIALIDTCIPASVITNAEIYTDDLQWDVDAPTVEETATPFVTMAQVDTQVLFDVIQFDIQGDLPYSKAAVVAAAPIARRSDIIARAVRRRLGPAGGDAVVAAQSFGIDYVVGGLCADRVTKPSIQRSTRYRRGASRAARAAVLKKNLVGASKHKTKRLFTSSVSAVAYCGVEVRGLDDAELAAAWRLAAKCLSTSMLGMPIGALALTIHRIVACRAGASLGP